MKLLVRLEHALVNLFGGNRPVSIQPYWRMMLLALGVLQRYKVGGVNVGELTYPFRIVILMKRRFLVKINLFWEIY